MPLILSAGNLMFYAILHQSELVPRWLSLLGFISTVLSGILASLLLMFGVIYIITPTYITLALPTALLEIVLAVWLIIKGFSAKKMNLQHIVSSEPDGSDVF